MIDLPSPGPYRPDARPHLARTALVLALIGALLLATAWLASEVSRPEYKVPPSVVTPGWYVPGNPTPQGTVPPMSDKEVWGW